MTFSRAAIAIVVVAVGCRDREPTAEPPPPPVRGSAAPTLAGVGSDGATAAANPVQAEMRMLTQILERTVRDIGTGDVRGLDAELHRLHAAKEATTAAVRSGAYPLPNGSASVSQFEAIDEAFHEHLGDLVMASRANDVPAAAEALGEIMRGCHGCHAIFRPEPRQRLAR